MKKLIWVGMALCLFVTIGTGCDKEKEPEQETEDTIGSIEDVVNALEASMVHVYGGTFLMGATAGQGHGAYGDESPAHDVKLIDFDICAYEVTQAQWKAVMGHNPSDFVGDDHPVEQVRWEDAVAFCEKLNEYTGWTYRLPTEAEWEYAARGGHKGDDTKYAGGEDLDGLAWYGNGIEGNSQGVTHPVGKKKPNALGLYDMSGNVWEWCSDWYQADYYSESPFENPQGPAEGDGRVFRGGSFDSDAEDCRLANREYGYPGYRNRNLGFRVVRVS